MASVQNIFQDPEETQRQGSISLSIYSQPERVARPRTAAFSRLGQFLGLQADIDQEKICKGVAGLNPMVPDEEGNLVAKEAPADDDLAMGEIPRVPEMDCGDLLAMQRSHLQQVRQEAYNEAKQIKEVMAREKIAIDVRRVLERSMMIPSEPDQLPEEKKYPDPGVGLMKNPFPPAKKKKKGKKK